ncbi:unnamed protein product [Rotaria socialis]|uniref:Exostosin GT47 domain-containing protein n=1 Tax=Rotaria socialis TaxID=392032 RepID=A0A817NQ14_9BILA|nr:unnamed protein product [Rotaria socialis]CAF4274149.1 unnamed protein product [Rotaria socialis]
MKREKKVKLFLLLILLTTTSLILLSIFISPNPPPVLSSTTTRQVTQKCYVEKHKPTSVYYRLSEDELYHYEFRYELKTPSKSDGYRLMIILYGTKCGCSDMWDFSVGDRILSAVRRSDYSILAICSKRKTYDIHMPISNNSDVKYIYLSLQIWMNTIYYPQFQCYPHLYIHATSRGSHFAGLLSRILPIQAQILYSYPGHRESMFIPSMYDVDMQTRLSLDPTFSNWFYFDFCYNKSIKHINDQRLCPFQSDNHYYSPVPPTFFTVLEKDPYQRVKSYTKFIMRIQSNSFDLGGKLLVHKEAMQLDILSPVKLSASYMQENFHIWCSKPHASQFFFEHYTNSVLFNTNDSKRQTCWCSKIDFSYFEIMPNVTKLWSIKKQNEYSEYASDIRIFQDEFCEEVCGDLMTTHSMVSRNIYKMLIWINKMNSVRRSLYIDDYLKRPLRIWMYDKHSLINNSTYFSSLKVNWKNIANEHQMYSPEYYLQDYFQRLNQSRKISRHHHFQWANNPLLADYFIIPSDFMFFYFHHQPSTLNDQQFNNLYVDLNENYMSILLANVCTKFSYWTLAPNKDQIGANHILIIPSGRNMGILYNETQMLLKNVIQLAFTGIRADLLPSGTPPQYVYRNIYITYRHQYDVIIPQSTLLQWRRNKSDDLDTLIKKKNQIFYFAGALDHIASYQSARSLLSSIKQDIDQKQNYKTSIQIQGKQYNIIKIISGHIKSYEYIQSVQSSVFILCPEGFLPWSPRMYESIQLGSIPMLLADNIVLPFERFIDWRSFTVKLNVSNIKNITSFVDRIEKLEQYIERKLASALPYLYAFRWPYVIVGNNETRQHVFDPQEDLNETISNVFYYISLELRCRRLEQFYGFIVESSTSKSMKAQQLACTKHPTVCPCHDEKRSVAFQEYI